MRQIADLMVGIVLVMVLAAAVYFTPRFAAYMSTDVRESDVSPASQSLAYHSANTAAAAR